ncbi:MAG: 16S rRNA (uracil(1498)-N(3))-methyltransferase [Oscillospiraceae bacterium]|jgi:16S rRNA (uracil1498-N3)-methyltransferase|nr:16S rRNA (uracil(1498)-N(3))-methyltransferase [Oscillospiraceae bacterium]
MPLPRFFTTQPLAVGENAALCETEHIRALRLRPGDEFTLCDGAGRDYRCELISLGRAEARAQILDCAPSPGEYGAVPEVFLAFSKGERLEYAVQKCVELGARSFVLFPSRNVVARPEGQALRNRLARLNAVARSAAEQCGRGIIPAVTAIDSFEAALALASRAELPLLPYELERERTLMSALRDNPSAGTVSVMTGAEGGFTPAEAELAIARGMKCVTLGARILRCETAPAAVCAALALCAG